MLARAHLRPRLRDWAAGISLASDCVRAYPDKYALLLSVELCTLTIQHDERSRWPTSYPPVFSAMAPPSSINTGNAIRPRKNARLMAHRSSILRRPSIPTPNTSWAGTFQPAAFRSCCHPKCRMSSPVMSVAIWTSLLSARPQAHRYRLLDAARNGPKDSARHRAGAGRWRCRAVGVVGMPRRNGAICHRRPVLMNIPKKRWRSGPRPEHGASSRPWVGSCLNWCCCAGSCVAAIKITVTTIEVLGQE